MARAADFSIIEANAQFVLIHDQDCGNVSVTNDAEGVIERLNHHFPGGLGVRKVFYRDSLGRFDQLVHDRGRFTGFMPCTQEQNTFFADF